MSIDYSSLHRSALVIDVQSPQINNALVVTPGMKAQARSLQQRGKSAREVRVAMSELLVDELRQNAAAEDEFRRIWEASGVTVACTSHLDDAPPAAAFEEAVRMLAASHALVDWLRPDWEIVTSAEDIRRIHSEGRHGLILSLQNATAFADDLTRISLFHNLGVRVVQLTYNRANLVGDGCLEPRNGGLSAFGREVVEILNEHRVMIDVSHCAAQTTYDVLEHSSAPVAMTHVTCDAVCPHDRAIGDEVLREMARAGGFVGVLLVPAFIQPEMEGDLSALARQIEHLIECVGVEHLGIGTDYGRCEAWPADPSLEYAAAKIPGDFSWSGWEGRHRLQDTFVQKGYARWTDWPQLTRCLLEDLQLSEREVRGLLGENFLRFFKTVVG